TEYRRRKRSERLHLVDGLLVALLNIDEVIQVIRSSDNAASAKTRLMDIFELSEIQAQYILDTPLRRLTRYDRLELEREQDELRADIASLTAILESDDLLRELVAAARATVRGTVGLVTSAGRLIKLNVLELPAMPPGAGAVSLAGGTPVTEFASFDRGETVVGLATVDSLAGGSGLGLALGTAEGVVKRVLPDYPQNRDEFELITLKPGDRVVGAVQLSGESDELVFITSDAQLLRFAASSVRPQGRAAGGMAGVRLSSGASVVWFGAADAGA